MAKKQSPPYTFENRQQTPVIADILHINVEEAKKDRLIQLDKLEEDRIMAIQHQEIKKQQ